MNKRKQDLNLEHNKKCIDDITQQVSFDNKDWPIYNHPNGGIIKITPWGSVRQFEENGQMVTKFEDMGFSDYDFTNIPLPHGTSSNFNNDNHFSKGMNESNLDNNSMNSNQMTRSNSFARNLSTMNSMNSLNNESSDYDLPQTPQSIKLSPCDEAENYVMKGYQQSEMINDYQNNHQQFAREQENYFGMMDDDVNE